MFRLKKKKKYKYTNIDPDEVFLDASNLPGFDTSQFEGRVVKSVSKISLYSLGVFFTLIAIVFLYKTYDLQIINGEKYEQLSKNNRLDYSVIFTNRGVIYDRNHRELAWNEPYEGKEYVRRMYTDLGGFSHLLGFVNYPKKDNQGIWWRTDTIGKSGIEKRFNKDLAGENGLKIIEVNALKKVQSENMTKEPKHGANIVLAIDRNLQDALYQGIKKSAKEYGYMGGAGVIMDVDTGEVVSIVSYPEYDSAVMSEGKDVEKIASYSNSIAKTFLFRPIGATYAPGSIMKPYVATAALSEKIISPYKKILSTGVLTIPNPYHPSKPSRFMDNAAHGLVDMRRAIAVSSNVYFYALGGGLKPNTGLGTQKGLGIKKLEEYAKKFGFGSQTGIDLSGELSGNIPTPEWKKRAFGEDAKWLLGNTYHSSIGQFGWLVTPIQITRYISVLASDGKVLTPHIIKDAPIEFKDSGINKKYFQVPREGMREAVLKGSLQYVNYEQVHIAGKTGTAQTGKNNAFKNSWVTGFWPYEKPKFAFAIVLEHGHAAAKHGSIIATRHFFDDLIKVKSPYLKGAYPNEKYLNKAILNKVIKNEADKK